MNSFSSPANAARLDAILEFIDLSEDEKRSAKMYLARRNATLGPIVNTAAIIRAREHGLIPVYYSNTDDGLLHVTPVFTVAVTTERGWEMLKKRHGGFRRFVETLNL